jgi:hypothetical protein
MIWILSFSCKKWGVIIFEALKLIIAI